MVQGHNPERENEKDVRCSKVMAERVPFPEGARGEDTDKSGCKPKLNRDIDDRKEVLSSLTFRSF